MSQIPFSSDDQDAIIDFLRDLVRTPSPSTRERDVAERIVKEMTLLGFRDITVDPVGNVIGEIGPEDGPVLLFNGHMDTVQVSDRERWQHDPFGAEIEDGRLYGLGSCDMKGGLAAMVYAGKLLQEADVELKGRLVVTCVVQEEPCEGLAARILIEEEGLTQDWVVLGEPSDLNVMRGQRGRIGIRVVTRGRSAHAANPELGDNAIYAAARLIFGLEILSSQLADDEFLGPGSLTVTEVTSSASSRNAVPDRCELIIDRRLTLGENETKALSELQRIITREDVEADVEILTYEGTSYTGHPCEGRESFPAWVLAADHELLTTVVDAVQSQLRQRVKVAHWDFSTDGVYTAGVVGIPTVGFGPGDPRLAHTSDEYVSIADVQAAAGAYAQIAARLLGAG